MFFTLFSRLTADGAAIRRRGDFNEGGGEVGERGEKGGGFGGGGGGNGQL